MTPHQLTLVLPHSHSNPIQSLIPTHKCTASMAGRRPRTSRTCRQPPRGITPWGRWKGQRTFTLHTLCTLLIQHRSPGIPRPPSRPRSYPCHQQRRCPPSRRSRLRPTSIRPMCRNQLLLPPLLNKSHRAGPTGSPSPMGTETTSRPPLRPQWCRQRPWSIQLEVSRTSQWSVARDVPRLRKRDRTSPRSSPSSAPQL